MCHEHLKIELKENINFIVGNNGSKFIISYAQFIHYLGGKSAILTGLTVCLGARASSTQRASKIEALIKEGTSEARVIVKISNSGALQFKGHLYGDSIIVERRFRRSGPSTFKVKSGENGRIISDRKDEVVAICDNYNIQVDNPLSVLTQETAKKFLVNSTPHDLYEFFMRATQLEQLSIDYAYSLDRMKSIQASLNTAKESWPALEETIGGLLTELKSIAEQKQIAQKVDELKAEIIWANIASLEKDSKEKEDQLLSEQRKLAENNEGSEILNRKLSETDLAIKETDTELTELYNSKKPINIEIATGEKILAKTKAEMKEIENVTNEINAYVVNAKEDLLDIETKLEQSLRDTDTGKIEIRNKVERLEQEVQDKNRQFREINQQISVKSKETEEIDGRFDNAKKIQSVEERSVEDLKKELDKSNSAAKDKIKFFGENLPQVMKIIQSKIRSFKYKPIGPIGLHVELTDMSWSKSMDAIIGSHLRSYITHDHEDRKLLEDILKSCNCQNSVINLSPDPIVIRDGEPDTKFLSALRVLRINNESVKKALIMFSSIEKILLISDRVEAREVMMARLRNVDSAYNHTHRVTVTQNSLAFFAIYSNSKGNPFESVEERIEQISRQLNDSSHRLRIATRDVNELQQSINNNNELEEGLKEQAKNLTREISASKSEIRTLEQSLKSADETGVEALKNERSDILNRIESLKSQFGECINSGMKSNEYIRNQEEALIVLKKSIENVDHEIENKRSNLSKLSHERRQIHNDIGAIKINCVQMEKNIKTISTALEAICKEISGMTEKASAICNRVNTKRPVAIIEKEIHRLDKLIEDGQEYSPERYETVKAEYDDRVAGYEKSKLSVQINENILDDMKIALEKRQRQWEDLRSGIAKRSNQDFTACLQARDYRGCLEYDHANRELNINVHIDQIEQNNSKNQRYVDFNDNTELTKRDIKQLSGGEKSYGTTCFLFSLWDAMGCPIRCLDEFDVYMDAVNRRLIVEMLINNARNSGTQFILITPVSVRTFLDIEDQESVHMVVLRDPQRSE